MSLTRPAAPGGHPQRHRLHHEQRRQLPDDLEGRRAGPDHDPARSARVERPEVASSPRPRAARPGGPTAAAEVGPARRGRPPAYVGVGDRLRVVRAATGRGRRTAARRGSGRGSRARRRPRAPGTCRGRSRRSGATRPRAPTRTPRGGARRTTPPLVPGREQRRHQPRADVPGGAEDQDRAGASTAAGHRLPPSSRSMLCANRLPIWSAPAASRPHGRRASPAGELGGDGELDPPGRVVAQRLELVVPSAPAFTPWPSGGG